jgi:L-ascorbate metabolism protein UlaG (beta-lactamase superfamily)
VKIHFFRHSFFKISSEGKRVIVDAYVNDGNCPEFAPLIKCRPPWKDTEDADIILITHEHFDHFEKDTVERIAGNGNSFVVGHSSVLNTLNLPQDILRPVKAFDRLKIKGVTIKCYPAHHPHSFYPLSYLITIGGKSVFHAGDTSLIERFSEIKADVALLPAGGTYTMDVVDAVRAVKMMKPLYAIPMHYNTFAQIKADPHEFCHRIEKSILKTKPVILEPDSVFTF